MRSTKTWTFVLLSALLAFGVAACGSSSTSSGSGGTISGAGSTFAQPIISQWGSELKTKDGLTVNYNSIGSGGGVSQFEANTVDFADSDAAMEDAQIKVAEKNGTPVHVPIVFGAVTVSYNLPGVKSGLKLDGATIAEIYLGKIKTWNDPAIAKLNPSVKLPSTAITVVHRSDSSGTTNQFTQFLSDYSPQWKSQLRGERHGEVAGRHRRQRQRRGGRLRQADRRGDRLRRARLCAAEQLHHRRCPEQGWSVRSPTLGSTTAAGEGVKFPPDLRFSAINASSSPKAYPIASATFVLVYEDLCKAGKSEEIAKNVVKFLDYGLGEGQQAAKKLDYAALSPELLKASQAKVADLTCNGKPIS